MDNLTNSMEKLASNERFDFSPSVHDRKWGVHVLGVGRRHALPGVPYQVFEAQAPIQWSRGRILRHYGLVYLSRGEGTFRTRGMASVSVAAGDLILLAPGIWHNYFPSLRVGWDEHWVLFNGQQAARIMKEHFRIADEPILHLGLQTQLPHLLAEMLTTAAENPPHCSQILAALATHALAVALSSRQLRRESQGSEESVIQSAKRYLDQHYHEPVEMDVLARSLNVSYRSFRRRFRASTGMAPRQYLLMLRINRAKRLLEEERTKLSAVAARSGFTDPYYFSRLFKQKTGLWPSEWRS